MEPEQESIPAADDSDLGSVSASSASYEYDPANFPRLNETEDFVSPSFFWSPSPDSSTSRIAQILYDNNLPKKLGAKLETKLGHLSILLSLCEDVVPALSDNSASAQAISEARQTLDEAFGFTDLDKAENMVGELEAAIASISDVLLVKAVLAKSIHLADLVAKKAAEVEVQHKQYRNCWELKFAAERLTEHLWSAARTNLYEPATRRIIDSTEQALYRAAELVHMCHTKGNIVSRIFNFRTRSAKYFRKVLLKLKNSIGDISWLLHICKYSTPAGWLVDDNPHSYIGPPPIAINEPLLYLIWEHVANLLNGSPEDKADAAAALASLASDRDRYGKLIIKAGGVAPLLKLIEATECEIKGQMSAMETLDFLCDDRDNAKIVVQDGEVCSVLIDCLRRENIELQAMAARVISQLAAHNRPCQDLFAKQNAIELLIRGVDSDASANQQKCLMALCALAKGNSRISRTIVDSRLMLHFPILLENSSQELQENTALLILEIARVAEGDAELRCYAFNPALPAGTAVVDQLLRIVANAESNKLLVLCIEALGSLSKIFWKNEGIDLLVQRLKEVEEDVVREAVVALVKFTEKKGNYLYKSNRKAVASAAKGILARLVYREDAVQKLALLLACQVASQVPDNKELAAVVTWASRQRALVQDAAIKSALTNWKGLHR